MRLVGIFFVGSIVSHYTIKLLEKIDEKFSGKQ